MNRQDVKSLTFRGLDGLHDDLGSTENVSTGGGDFGTFMNRGSYE